MSGGKPLFLTCSISRLRVLLTDSRIVVKNKSGRGACPRFSAVRFLRTATSTTNEQCAKYRRWYVRSARGTLRRAWKRSARRAGSQSSQRASLKLRRARSRSPRQRSYKHNRSVEAVEHKSRSHRDFRVLAQPARHRLSGPAHNIPTNLG